MAQGAVEYARSLGWEHPQIVLHLDHGDSFELCKDCIENGFSSVMIDGSHLPYEENVALTKEVCDYAHRYGVTVEGELGVLAGVEDEVSSDHHTYTDPEEVIDFVTRTGVDSLAISIGTSHGAYKFTPEQCTRDPKTGRLVPPPLAFNVLEAVEKKLPISPLYSTVRHRFRRNMSRPSTNMAASFPMPSVFPRRNSARLRRWMSARSTSTPTPRLAMTAAVRKLFHDKPAEFDPRKYLGPARDEMERLYKHKIINVLGSEGKAE